MSIVLRTPVPQASRDPFFQKPPLESTIFWKRNGLETQPRGTLGRLKGVLRDPRKRCSVMGRAVPRSNTGRPTIRDGLGP